MRYQPCASYEPLQQFLTLARNGTWHDLFVLPQLGFEIMQAALKKAHPFVFDFAETEATGNTEAVAQFTADCITSGLFQPPFDATLLQWPEPPDGHWRYAAALILTLQRKGETTEWGHALEAATRKFARGDKQGCVVAAFGFGVHPTDKEDSRVPAFFQDISIITSWNSGRPLVLNGGEKMQDMEHVCALNMFSPRIPDGLNRTVQDAGVSFRNVLYYMGVLSSRGPIATTMAPEPRVAEKRLREGRSPWISYSLISLPQFSESRGDHSGISGIGRSSPRQHWRRGHIRELASGRLTPVCPCLVGASDLGKVIASYHVGKEAADVTTEKLACVG